MKTAELRAARVSAASDLIPPESPFVMLTLLRYKTVADYGNDSNAIPCSGREAHFTLISLHLLKSLQRLDWPRFNRYLWGPPEQLLYARKKNPGMILHW